MSLVCYVSNGAEFHVVQLKLIFKSLFSSLYFLISIDACNIRRLKQVLYKEYTTREKHKKACVGLQRFIL